MNIKLQIISLFISCCYGGLLFILIRKFYKLLTIKKIMLKITFNITFSISISIIYFLMMYLLNDGYLHLYYLLSIIFGFLLVYQLTK